MRKIYSSLTILNCTDNIPNGVPCLIKASSYKIEIIKIDICKNNPFQNYRSTPDYGGSYCLNLFDKEKANKIVNFSSDPTFEIPRAKNKNEEFQYISIILKNRFTVSGKYKSGENIWITNNKGPKNIIKLKSNLL